MKRLKITGLRRVVTLLAAAGMSAGIVATVSGQAGANTVSPGSSFFPDTAAAVAFHDQMRKLWEDHVTWTRLAIVSLVGGTDGTQLPDTDATVDRLLQNQRDIGAAIVPYFGQAAGDQLTTLLLTHITLAKTLVLDAKAGDTAGVNATAAAWYDNAQQIADFLSAANPKYWPQDTMRAALKAHLDQTLQEAVDQIQHNVTVEAGDYEAAHQHILEIADLLSSGIIQKFHNSFEQH